MFGNTLNFAPLVDLASIISIYNYSTVNPDTKLVYLFGKFKLARVTQNQIVLVRASEELLDDYHFPIATFASAQVQAECQFHHPTYPAVTNQARYLWRMFTSSGVVCDLPILQDSPETYTPRLVIDDETHYAATPLQMIKARKVQHKLCQCMVMWKRSEFLLEYMKYYTDVHGFSHTIILAQDRETMESLRWLQALYSIELILWPEMYTQVAMTSYCTLLAQQQCE